MVVGKLKESAEEGIIFKIENVRKLRVEQVSSFVYLGVLITRDGCAKTEMHARLVDEGRSVGALGTIIKKQGHLPKSKGTGI